MRDNEGKLFGRLGVSDGLLNGMNMKHLITLVKHTNSMLEKYEGSCDVAGILIGLLWQVIAILLVMVCRIILWVMK